MSLLSKLFRKNLNSPLVGSWRQVDDPNVSMEFFVDGRLEYRVRNGDELQIIKLTYRIDGSEVVSNQPSAPREERTAYSFDGSVLILSQAGQNTRFVRAA